MRKFIIFMMVFPVIILCASAVELTAPEVPSSAAELMPETNDFGQGLLELLRKASASLRPDLLEALRCNISVLAAAMLISIAGTFSESIHKTADITGATVISSILLLSTNSLIRLGAETINELSEYGKLLLPVMTAALAAQGGITSSAALYAGTAAFSAVLGKLISGIFVPFIYVFLCLAAASAALGEEMLKKMKDLLKSFISWSLKTILTVFTTYMSITGVISGTTDAAALKATKVTISSVVPVVGGILSDASEAVLVGAGLVKNSVGIYGILAILAVVVSPFFRIGAHYIILKLTSAICDLFSTKRMTDLVADFSTAMGLLLALTGSACLLLLISTICFMKGVG